MCLCSCTLLRHERWPSSRKQVRDKCCSLGARIKPHGVDVLMQLWQASQGQVLLFGSRNKASGVDVRMQL